jgi:hypothetical protein
MPDLAGEKHFKLAKMGFNNFHTFIDPILYKHWERNGTASSYTVIGSNKD